MSDNVAEDTYYNIIYLTYIYEKYTVLSKMQFLFLRVRKINHLHQ